MYLVLGSDRVRACSNFLDSSEVDHWFQSYEQLLHQFRLFNQVALLRQQSPPALRELRREIRGDKDNPWLFCSNCSRCNRALVGSDKGGRGPKWWCRRCGALPGKCAVCHRRARGVLVWCQGCSHGGHLACYKGWFGGNGKIEAGLKKDSSTKLQLRRQCPTGCNHYCQFQ